MYRLGHKRHCICFLIVTLGSLALWGNSHYIMRNLSSTIKAPQEKELSPNNSYVREPLAKDPQALVNPGMTPLPTTEALWGILIQNYPARPLADEIETAWDNECLLFLDTFWNFFCSNREYTIFQISLEPGNILLFFPFFFSFLHLMRSCSYTCPGTNSMTHHVLSNGPSRPLPIDTGHDHLYSLLFSYLVFITIDKLLNGDWLSSKAWDCANGHSVCLLLCGASCFFFPGWGFFLFL